MFVAHLPAGYILTRILGRNPMSAGPLWAGLLSSVLPDADLLWFYLADERQHIHHDYWTHQPVFWAAIAAVWFTVMALSGDRLKKLRAGSVLFFSGILLHLVLDTFSGGISWLYPLSDHSFNMVTVTDKYGWWVWNFIFHWTFLAEVAIIAVALVMLLKSRRRRPASAD